LNAILRELERLNETTADELAAVSAVLAIEPFMPAEALTLFAVGLGKAVDCGLSDVIPWPLPLPICIFFSEW
jgi:hypothetical protein